MRLRWFSPPLLCVLTLFAVPRLAGAISPPADPTVITIGRSVVVLNGPWKFHVGDDPRWAESGFDDAGWEEVDLTPPPGAHDADVGLTGLRAGLDRQGAPRLRGLRLVPAAGACHRRAGRFVGSGRPAGG